MAEVLRDSRAPNTAHKYENAFSAWEKWCEQHEVTSLPAKVDNITRYFIYQFNGNAPYSRIETAFYGIKWRHDCLPNLSQNPCDSKFLHNVLQGLKRRLAKPITKKEPITPEMLKAIVEQFRHTDNLLDIRLCTMLLLAYSAFFDITN